MAKEYRYRTYLLKSEEEVEACKKENELIEYIKAKTDLSNAEVCLGVYNRMIDRKMVNTPVGIDFLKGLRNEILKTGIITEDKLKALPKIKEKKVETLKEPANVTAVNKLKQENTALKIVVFAMAVIIAGMFIIALTGRMSGARRVYEKQILDSYAGWKEELDEQQEWINEQLLFLEENGITMPDSN